MNLLPDRMTKSGIIQICLAAALKGTLQLNGTRQGYQLSSVCFYSGFLLWSAKTLESKQEGSTGNRQSNATGPVKGTGSALQKALSKPWKAV